MAIKYSKHARERLKERGVEKNRITKTINSPDETLLSFRGRKLRKKRFGSKILEVVTKEEKSETTVITAYYLKGK